MKAKKSVRKPLVLVAGALFLQALNLHGQSAPAITIQPTNQTVLVGTNVTFSVAVDGTGPFTYQWQFNGTNLANDIITTVAGNGSHASGNYGHGIAATSAALGEPCGVALDGMGSLYIADEGGCFVRKVDTNGIITTVASNGKNIYSGDGGKATNASLDGPFGVASDAVGNLFIADLGNKRIRKVGTNGIITTVAGSGVAGFSGDGGQAINAALDGPSAIAWGGAGNLYIADTYNSRIRKVDTNGIITTVAGSNSAGYFGDGGAATNASLNYPWSVALDAVGNLYIADTDNNVIRKVDTNGIITTVAGNGTNGYSGDGGPATNANLNNVSGVAVDPFGNIYVVDQDNNRVRKVDTNGIINTVAGGGSNGLGDGGVATNATLYEPFGVALDALCNLYIGDEGNGRVRKVLLYAGYPAFTLSNVGASYAGNYTVVVTSPYGSVTSAVATLTVQAPPVITVSPASQLAVAGSSPGFSVAVAGSGPFGYLWYLASTNLVQSGTNSTLTLPGVVANQAGNYTVVVTNAWGSVTSRVATLTVGFPPSVTNQQTILTVLAGTNVSLTVTVAGTGPFSYQWQLNGVNFLTNIITTVAGNGIGTYAGDGGAATNASLHNPSGVAVDAAGDLFVADTQNTRIRTVDTNGIITTYGGGYVPFPLGLALDASNNLYVASIIYNEVFKMGANGRLTAVAGGGFGGDGSAATNASLSYPWAVAFDCTGNLYIADYGNNRIRKVDDNGIISTVAGNGSHGYSGDSGLATTASLSYPSGVALDAAGNLYIVDAGNNRIRKVGANGIITTVAGNGSAGYSGDGGAATNASVATPAGVGLDTYGNLFFADYYNNRIRKVDTNGIISTVAGGGIAAFSGDGGPATNASLAAPYGVALDASGNLYIADYTNNRIREVQLAGYPTLALTNVTASNAGSYTVVIASPYGSVTSAVATLTVTIPQTPPQIMAGDGSFGFVTNQFGFKISGATGQTIVVDGSTDLVNWTPLCTNTAGGNPFYFCDPCWSNFPGRFYRARLQ
jgi:sugar lactone lactonase YvrE